MNHAHDDHTRTLPPARLTTLGGWLAYLRRQAHWTQLELAEAAGLSAETVSHIERGVVRATRGRGRGADGATRALLVQALQTRFAELAEARGRAHWLSREEAAELSARATHLFSAPPGPLAPTSAPSQDAGAAGTGALPVPPTSFVGRVHERAAVAALLAQPEVRLLTLTGPGGVGKTRLALQVAAERPAGAAPSLFIALAALRDPAAVLPAIARALGVREAGATPLLAAIQSVLAERALLLVLDNCEQVRDAAPDLAALLSACPRLQVLATSRAPWHLQGEHEYALSPLALPPAEETAPETLAASEAVALFVARAQAVKPQFALTVATAPTVAALCRQLDGLPLAIELAAAQLRLLTPRALLRLLERRLPLLVGGPRDAPERQQTLRATLNWSYELLNPAEQTLFRRLCVFVGGCRLEALAAVCGDGAELAGDLLQCLGALVDQSLVRAVEQPDGEPRFVLLETIREYGLERLEESGEAEGVRQAHAAYHLALAEKAQEQLTGPEQGVWLGRLEVEHDNLRAALRWARERGEGERGLRLAGALWRFWNIRGYLSEGRSWLEMASTQDAVPAAVRAVALNGAGNLAFAQGDYGRAAALHEEALALRRELGDTVGIANSLNNLGNAVAVTGDFTRATALHEEALALRRALGDRIGLADSLNNLGSFAVEQGDVERARALHEEALALRRALGDASGIAASLRNLGNVASARGDYGRAAVLHEEALALRRELGDRIGIADSLHSLGTVLAMQGDYSRAAALYAECLMLSHELGANDEIAASLEGLAWMAAVHGQSDRAARLGGAAEALRQALATFLLIDQRAGHEQAVRTARAALGEECFAVAWTAGRALQVEEAIALALSEERAPTERASDSAVTCREW